MDHARLLAELGAVAVGSGFLAFQTRRHKQEKVVLLCSSEIAPVRNLCTVDTCGASLGSF